jgi:hypothetical protein
LELDAELAAGTDPLRSDELSLRAGQLRSPKARIRASRSLLGALEIADRPSPFGVPPPVRRRELRTSRALVADLVDRLSDGGDVSVRGLAMTSQLLRDRHSPLHSASAGRSLRATLMSVLVALDRAPSRN